MDIYEVSCGKTHKEQDQKVLLKPSDGKEALVNDQKAFTYQVEIYPPKSLPMSFFAHKIHS